jgi:hypothetical protein
MQPLGPLWSIILTPTLGSVHVLLSGLDKPKSIEPKRSRLAKLSPELFLNATD